MIWGYHYFLETPIYTWSLLLPNGSLSPWTRQFQEIGERYGHWQDAECRDLKRPLGWKLRCFLGMDEGLPIFFGTLLETRRYNALKWVKCVKFTSKMPRILHEYLNPEAFINQCTWAENVSHLRSFVQTREERHRTRSFEGHRGIGRSNDSNVWCVFTWL